MSAGDDTSAAGGASRDAPASPQVADLGLDVAGYYAQAAATYDADRFGSSYGRYLDALERGILRRWLTGAERILEIGCGTGRLLDLATDGVDPSPEMLAIARGRHPERRPQCAPGTATPFRDGSFDAVFSMHVFMHLPREENLRIIEECRRLLRPGGALLFDVPGQPRRDLTGFRPASWHCGTAWDPAALRQACSGWRWRGYRGLLALPIHRLPAAVRPALVALDRALGRSFLRRWCSYYLVRLEKPA